MGERFLMTRPVGPNVGRRPKVLLVPTLGVELEAKAKR